MLPIRPFDSDSSLSDAAGLDPFSTRLVSPILRPLPGPDVQPGCLAPASHVVNLPIGILVVYTILTLLMMRAWLAISKNLTGSYLPGIIVTLMAIFYHNREIGGNQLIEESLIPRYEAYVFAYWGLYCLLKKKPILAGLCMAGAAYLQLAIGVLFGLPMLLWLLVRHEKGDLKHLLLFASAFLIAMMPQLLLQSGEFLNASSITSNEEILFAAYIRHPHHMIPHLWGWKWPVFFGILIIFCMILHAIRRNESLRGLRSFAGLGWVIIALLSIATIFIEIFPVKNIIELQPFRMALLLYFVMFLVIAPHIISLLKSPDYFSKLRGLSLIVAGFDERLAVIVAGIEIFHLIYEQKGCPITKGSTAILVTEGFLLAIAVDDDLWRVSLSVAAFAALWVMAERGRFFHRPKLVYAVGTAAALAGTIFIVSFFFLPYEKWIKAKKPNAAAKLAMRSFRYQFNPFPIKPIEQIAQWASSNTPKEALFIIPPDRDPAGFHLWAKRSVFFCMKFFPYNPQGMALWRERYFAIRGVKPGDQGDAEKMAEVLSDYGGEKILSDYKRLTADQILNLAKKYGADHILTPAVYPAPHFKKIYEVDDPTKTSQNKHTLYAYHIIP